MGGVTSAPCQATSRYQSNKAGPDFPSVQSAGLLDIVALEAFSHGGKRKGGGGGVTERRYFETERNIDTGGHADIKTDGRAKKRFRQTERVCVFAFVIDCGNVTVNAMSLKICCQWQCYNTLTFRICCQPLFST